MATKTVEGVELVATGTWNASTGKTTITRADLEAMLAARDDVDHAPVKLGHRSSLNEALGDGAPAYGWVVPTKIENRNGRDVLIGDLKDVPAKLAEAMHSAYRQRSAEIAWGLKGMSGTAHKAALVGIALLGIAAPAVKGLADALSFHSEAEGQAEEVSTVTWLAEADTPALNAPTHPVGNDEDMTDGPKEAAVAADVREQFKKLLEQAGDEDLRKMIEEVVSSKDDAATVTEPAVVETPREVPTAPAAETPAVETPRELATAGTVTLSEATFAEMQRELAWAKDKRRAEILDSAVTGGRISPAERAHFAAMLDRDEEGTTTLLSSLGTRYAVTELGADQAPANSDVDDDAVAAYINSTPFGQ